MIAVIVKTDRRISLASRHSRSDTVGSRESGHPAVGFRQKPGSEAFDNNAAFDTMHAVGGGEP
jgi:hypothetical protein